MNIILRETKKKEQKKIFLITFLQRLGVNFNCSELKLERETLYAHN